MNHYDHIRLIVTDMDGTLLDDDKRLDRGIFEVIAQLQKKGIAFTLASGRNVHIMKPYVEQLGLCLPYITNNGANIFQNETCIYEKTMVSEELAFAYTILRQADIPFIAYASNAVYTLNLKERSMQFFLDRLKGKTQIIEVNQEQDILKHEIFKVVMVNQKETLMCEIMQVINKKCKELHCVRSEDMIYTITHIEADKGKALSYLMNFMQVNKEETMVFGDNFNDITMFQEAGISVAMENGQESVKSQADDIAPANNKNGVSTFLKTCFDI